MSTRPGPALVATSAATDATTPLYRQLRENLRARILDNALLPLARLPSESELMRLHSVSRITVRQALNDLQKEGLIFKVQGKGAFVSKPKLAQDVTRLQGLAEAMSREHHVRNRILSLKTVRANPRAAERLSLAPNTVVCRITSLRYLDRQPIAIDVSYVSQAIGRSLQSADLAARDLIDIYENDLGLSLGNADLVIEAAGAGASEAKHLQIARGAPVLRIERVIYTTSGQALHFEAMCYRGDAFRYRLRIDRGARQP
ncbi:MAG: GntR family transcriptional regulator [Betaproteobacteria bacterium]